MTVSKSQYVRKAHAEGVEPQFEFAQADKLNTLISAANVDVEPIWATLLAKALEGKNVKELLSNVGSGGGAPATGVAPAAASAAAATAPVEEEKKEEKKEEKEESDDDMVCFSLTVHGRY